MKIVVVFFIKIVGIDIELRFQINSMFKVLM